MQDFGAEIDQNFERLHGESKDLIQVPSSNIPAASGGLKRSKKPVVDTSKPAIKRGILQKSSPSWFKGWQERYVILHDGKLKYYKNIDS